MPDKSKEDYLRRKHGFSDPVANYEIEKTDRYLIAYVKKVGLQKLQNPLMRRHFERKIAFHEKFDTEESYVK